MAVTKIFFRKYRTTPARVGLKGTVRNKRLMMRTVSVSCIECSEYKSYFSDVSLRIEHMFFRLTTVDRETTSAFKTFRLRWFSLCLFLTIS